MLHLKIKSFFTVFFYTLFLLNLLGFFPGTDADTPFVICIEYYCELLWTVGNEAFFRWVPPVVEPAICPVILQSWPRIVACVSMDVTRILHPWRVSMVFTRILHPFCAFVCFERWVSKSVCPWSDVFFMSVSETDFNFDLCHTMGTDDECDLRLSLFWELCSI